jgi:glyoxylase-like metal-dependent hydrolase (beta-lactamase superfamily II)
VFTGDVVFHGGHPVVWSGPVANWIAACDRILSLQDVHTVVPGHGAVTDLAAVGALKGYFEHLNVEARRLYDAGLAPPEAARTVDLGPSRVTAPRADKTLDTENCYAFRFIDGNLAHGQVFVSDPDQVDDFWASPAAQRPHISEEQP